MIEMNPKTFLIGLVLVYASVVPAGAAPSESATCEIGKNKAVGKYAMCRQAAEAKAVKDGVSPDFTKCDEKFSSAWGKLEAAAGGMCPTNGDEAGMEAFVASHTDTVAAALAGAGLPSPSCGDGSVNVAGEQCDGSDLGGATCADFGYTLGTPSCDSSCRLDPSSCSSCPSGVEYAGSCVLLGGDGMSCELVCTSAGLGYVPPYTTNALGSGAGTGTQCDLKLEELLGSPNSLNQTSCAAGVGCAVVSGVRTRCTSPTTTGSASAAGYRRVCVCTRMQY